MTHASRVRAVTKTGLPDAIIGDDLRHGEILNANYQPDGRMRPEEAQRLMPLIPIPWTVASPSAGQLVQRIELPQPGSIERLAAMVTTTPSGGPLVVILTGQTSATAPFEIARVTIPAGRNEDRIPITPQPLPAGTWLGVQLGAPNGAAGLSVTAAFRAEA